MHSSVHGADVQDKDGSVVLMASLFGLFPYSLYLYGESG